MNIIILKLKYIAVIYLALVHAFVLVLFIKTNALELIANKLGIKQTTAELTPHYHQMTAFLSRVDKNLPEGVILFIGDSLIQGMAVTAVTPGAVNFGIGSDTTLGVLKRIQGYRSLASAKLVVLAIGVNDLRHRENSAIVENLAAILNLMPDHTPVIVNAVLPVDEPRLGKPGFNDRIRALNAKLEVLVNRRQNTQFLDIGAALIDESGMLAGQRHIGDGLHLSQSGYDLWIAALKTAVVKLNKSRTNQ